MSKKGQTAIEFITTYSFTFLIIAMVLLLLIFYATLPKQSLPVSCTAYGGFNCVDDIYFNLVSGSQFVAKLTNSQPGIINVSSFNVVINSAQSTNGFCVPSGTTQGQTVYCVANFIIPETLGNIYTGTFDIAANYCAKAPGNLHNLSCPPSNSYTFGGSFRTEGSSAKPFVFITYRISNVLSAQSSVLYLDGLNYHLNQLPMAIPYQYGTIHTLYYRPAIFTGGSLYIFNSLIFNSIWGTYPSQGCSVTANGQSFNALENCTVTATYNSINYAFCSQIPNGGSSNLQSVTANYCNLAGYDLENDNFNNADLSGSNMENANLYNANLNSDNLAYVDLAGANVLNDNFNSANMIGAYMPDIIAPATTNFNNANMEFADLQGADLSGANLRGTYLQFADLGNADLSYATFTNANLAYANLEGANVVGADFTGANVVGCTGCP